MIRSGSVGVLVAVLVLSAALVVPSACRKETPPTGPAAPGSGGSPPPAAEPAQGGAAAALAAAGFAEGPSALVDVPALLLLPRETLAVAVAANPTALLDRLGRERIVQRFRAFYEQGVAAVTGATGVNLLDPAQYREIGIDATKPLGIAWLDVERESGALFFSLGDAETLKTWLSALAGRFGQQLSTEVAGEALILCPQGDEELCLVLRGGVGVLTFSGAGDEEGLATARAIAAVTPEASIGRLPAFAEAAASLRFGRDVGAFLNVPALVRADAGLLADLLEPIGPIAFGLGLAERGVVLEGRAAIPEQSLLGRLFRPAAALPIAAALSEPPLWVSAVTSDPTAYRDLLGKALASEGESFGRFAEELAKETGIQLDRDVLSVLDGSLGLAVTGRIPEQTADEDAVAAALGGALVIGVKDPARATALLGKLRALPPLAPIFGYSETTKRYFLRVPDWKTIHLAVTDGAIAASTDAGFLDRFANGQAGTWLATAGPEQRALLTLEGASAVGYLDAGGPIGALLTPSRSYSALAPAPAIAVGPGEPPPSEAWLAKRAELQAAHEELDAQEAKLSEVEHRGLFELVRMIGPTALAVRRDGDRLDVYGGQYLNAESVPKFVETTVAAAVDQATTVEPLRRNVWSLQERIRQLNAALAAMRAAELLQRAEQPALPPAPPTP
jgi:hypothetical protein